jgi:hypothetical protein
MIGLGLLKKHADAPAQILLAQGAQVDPVPGDGALLRVVEAAEQLEQRALARAVLADDGDNLARRDRQDEARCNAVRSL